jgi:Tfp pilus assembly protein PilP
MRRQWIKSLSVALILAFSGMTVCACTPDTGVKRTRVKKTSDTKSKRTSIDRAQLEMTADNWKPVLSTEKKMESRNPFRGFSDKIMAESLKRQRMKETSNPGETSLPEQLYNTKDYKVVAVITGTADPKVYVKDPAGNQFVLRKGSRLGNNNGSISSIHRNGIEVYELVAEKGQYIELPLYDAKGGEHKNIQISLQ